ncbi:MAG TPA: dipeptidase [Terriglobales bacterium]|nr:dipeptidase [Terriglobales bacterium]
MRTIISLLLLSACAFAQSADIVVSPKAKQIEDSAIVVDTHADTPGRFVDENFDPATDAGTHHWDFAKARQANLGAEFFSIWVDPDKYKGHYVDRAQDMIDSVYEAAKNHPDQMMMARSVADIEQARCVGRFAKAACKKKVAALMGLEGGHAIDNDIRILRNYYRLGVRYMTLSWSNTNEFADSSGDVNNPKVEHHNGLTDFGKQIVQEMNRMGMIVDISHTADKTFYDAIEISKAPVIASHSSARALANHPRNMTDDMLKALAKNGGVAQVNFNCGFVDEKYRVAEQEWNDKQKQQQGAANANYDYAAKPTGQGPPAIPRPPFKSLIDQFDHMIKVAGIDHVGIGSDFDGVECLPEGINSVADLPKITQALLDRGYTAADMKKVLGGNMMRVFAQVETVSREMSSQPAK